MTKDSPPKLPDKPPEKPQEKTKPTRRQKLEQFLRNPPEKKGWVVIGCIIVFLAVVITFRLTPNLHLDKDVIMPFSSMMVEIFIILFATFAGGYFALATLVKRLKKPPEEGVLEFEGPVSLLQRMKRFRFPILMPVLLVILMSIFLVFLYYPLSMNLSIATFLAVLILEIALVGGWFFVIFIIEVAVTFEEGAGVKQ